MVPYWECRSLGLRAATPGGCQRKFSIRMERWRTPRPSTASFPCEFCSRSLQCENTSRRLGIQVAELMRRQTSEVVPLPHSGSLSRVSPCGGSMLFFNDVISVRYVLLKTLASRLLISLAVFAVPAAIPHLDAVSASTSSGEASYDEMDREFTEVNLGLEADLEFNYERQGDFESGEVTFDEVGIMVDGDWWQVETGIKYESETDDIRFEEVVVQLGCTEDSPWFLRVGRTVLPFAEFNSRFIEDPLGTVIGETDENALVFGCETDDLEAFFGIYRGEQGARDGINIVTSARFAACRDIHIGLGFSNDLGESVELHEISQDGESCPVTVQAAEDEVAGVTGFLLAGIEPVQISLEYLTALKSFGAGFLEEDPRKPSAFNLEIGVQPFDEWIIAARIESAHGFPENPKRQYGVSTSYRLNEHTGYTAEYLYGDFAGDSDGRHLVSSALTLEY
jgi:hypothetical protein